MDAGTQRVKQINFKLINSMGRFLPFILVFLTLFLFTRLNDIITVVMAADKIDTASSKQTAPASGKGAPTTPAQPQPKAPLAAPNLNKLPGENTAPPASGGQGGAAAAGGASQAAQGQPNLSKDQPQSGTPKGFTLGLSADGFDILKLTPQQVKVLENLASRRESIEKRAAEVDQKKAFLLALEKRVDEKTKKLQVIKENLDSMTKGIAEKESKAVEELSLIYKNMKPKIAAQKLNGVDEEVVLLIFSKLQPKAIAAILSHMDQKMADDITTKLAKQSEPTCYGSLIPTTP